jgi:hypothetical protein
MSKERFEKLKNESLRLCNDPSMDTEGNLSSLQQQLKTEISNYSSYSSQYKDLSEKSRS